jgi:hypothetical protein
MPTLRQKKMDDILKILQDKEGEAEFRYVFTLMFQKYSLTKKTLWDYLDALKTSGKIDYPEGYITGQENEILIRTPE